MARGKTEGPLALQLAIPPDACKLIPLLVALAAAIRAIPNIWVGPLADDYGLALDLQNWGRNLFWHSGRPFYRPLPDTVWSTMGLQGAMVAHVLIIALHSLNALLVYLLVRRFTRSGYAGCIAGMLFALHPVTAEAIAWSCCLYDVSATALVLATLHMVELAMGSEREHRRMFLALSLAGYVLALMCKEVAVALPFLVAIRLWSCGWGIRRMAKPAIVYAAVTIAYVCVRRASVFRWDVYGLSSNPVQLLQTPLYHLGRYIFPINGGLFSHHRVLEAAVVLIMTTAAVSVARFAKGARPWFWSALFLSALIPTWNMPPVGCNLREGRLSYLPLVFLAGFTAEVSSRIQNRRVVTIATAGILALFLAMSVWYYRPWYEARRTADTIIAKAVIAVQEVPRAPIPWVHLYGMPQDIDGAFVLRNGTRFIVPYHTGRIIRIVDDDPDRSKLPRAKHWYEWDAARSTFVCIKNVP